MPEVNHVPVLVLVIYCCDICSKSPNPGCELKFIKESLWSNRFHYNCTYCNREFILDKKYPYIKIQNFEE